VLDIGCGSGNMAKAIKRELPHLEVSGVDFANSAIESASREPGGVNFIVAPAERLPFPDASIDAVTMFDVLEHVDKPDEVLSEVARVLRPGGLFHIALPLEGQPGTIYRLIGAGHRWRAKLKYAGHIQIYSDDRFRAEASAARLPVEHVRWSHHHVFALVDVVFFSIVEWRGPLKTSVEDAVASTRGPLRTIAGGLKGLVAAVGWGEARAFAWMKGACGSYLCVRS
jgi:SAM-dependent methyltransferase